MWKKMFKPKPCFGSSETSCLARVTDGKKVRFKRLRADVAYPSAGNPENFTLQSQLDAGVELREENSMLLQPKDKVVNEKLSDFVTEYDKDLEKRNHKNVENNE